MVGDNSSLMVPETLMENRDVSSMWHGFRENLQNYQNNHILMNFQNSLQTSEQKILELTAVQIDDTEYEEFKSGARFSVREFIFEVRQLLFFQLQTFDSSVQSAFSLFCKNFVSFNVFKDFQ